MLLSLCATKSRAAWEGLMSSLQMTEEEIAESRERAQWHVSFRRPGEKNAGQFIGLL